MNEILVYTTLDKEHIENETEQQCDLIIKNMILRVPDPDEAVIKGLAGNERGTSSQVEAAAKSFYNEKVGFESTAIQGWISSYREQHARILKEHEEAKAHRDSVNEFIEDGASKVLPLNPQQKVQVALAWGIMIVVVVAGYAALTEIIRQTDANIHPILRYTLPIMGVAVGSTIGKLFLTPTIGTPKFRYYMLVVLAVGFIACITWLYLFSGFIAANSGQVQFQSLDGPAAPLDAESGSAHANRLFIMAGVLGETALASALWAYKDSIYHANTVKTEAQSPEWARRHQLFLEKEAKIKELNRRIHLCESLIARIDAGRESHVHRWVAAYQGMV